MIAEVLMMASLTGGSTIVERQLVISRPQRVRYLVGNPYYDYQSDRDARVADAVIQRLVDAGVIEAPKQLALHEQQCANCHHGKTDAPQWAASLKPGEITRALRAIASGRMPKGRNLTVDQKNYLLQSLLNSEKGIEKWSEQSSPRPSSPPAAPVPTPPKAPTSASDKQPTSTYK